MGNTIETKDLLTIYNRFINTDTKIIKTNLKNACKGCYGHGYKAKFAQDMGLTVHQYQTMINASHPSNIPFENFIKLVGHLKLNLDQILIDQKLPVEMDRSTKIWTKRNKKKFIQYYTKNGLLATIDEYGLSLFTVKCYYNAFTKELSN